MLQSDRRTVLVLKPEGDYPRHSEGAFLRLKDGGILFVYSRFHSDWLDDAPSDIVGITSYDEGETWSEPRVYIAAKQFNTENVMSCTLLRMENGDLGLFYLVKANTWTYQLWLSRSRDEGETFYEHRQCSRHRGDGIYVVNNDRVRRLSSGRIIIPLAIHRILRLDGENKRYYDYRAVTFFLYSDDDGLTFNESSHTLAIPLSRSHSGLQEPGVIELNENLLWAYMRTDMMFQYESFSFDQGDTWTQPQPSRFTSPCSPMLVVRRPDNGWLYAVFNPIPEYLGRNAPKTSGGRTPIVFSISEDNGKTWGEEQIIADDPVRGYCYPAVFFTKDGCMLVSYCSGSPEQLSCLAETTISKVKL